MPGLSDGCGVTPIVAPEIVVDLANAIVASRTQRGGAGRHLGRGGRHRPSEGEIGAGGPPWGREPAARRRNRSASRRSRDRGGGQPRHRGRIGPGASSAGRWRQNRFAYVLADVEGLSRGAGGLRRGSAFEGSERAGWRIVAGPPCLRIRLGGVRHRRRSSDAVARRSATLKAKTPSNIKGKSQKDIKKPPLRI
jgi:hypothetical protein